MSDDDPMMVGRRQTVRVSIVMDYYVDVETPPDGDPGDQADFELFARGAYDDYAEKEVLNAEVVDEEPLWEDDFDDPEGWPSHV